MFTINNPTFGSDFEMPIIDSEGKPISAVYKLGGSKKNPKSIGEGCFVQEDNVNAEMNIPVVDRVEDWEKFIKYSIDKVNTELYKIDPGYKLYPASSFIYDESELDTAAACEFGCEPSYNAYNFGLPFERPFSEEPRLRSAGFHIHVGFEKPENFDLQGVCEFIKHMDAYVGMPSIIIDTDTRRRELYGKPGEFRARLINKGKIAVIEYRTLGTGILKDIRNISWIYEATQVAIASHQAGWEIDSEEVYRIIMENDRDAAIEMCTLDYIDTPFISDTVEKLECQC